jgi:branched-chain amino acid transport system ATP-binding protein
VTEPLLELIEVSKRYGSLLALHEVSFTIAPGEIVGVIGPNGAGKTTMIGVLSGSTRATRGDVRLFGRSIVRLRPDQIGSLGVARSFQLAQPFSGMRVLECTMLGALFGTAAQRHISVASARSFAYEILGFVGLQAKAQTLAENLNVPERKKLELARTLAARPKLMLLDEVMAGLNATEIGETMSLLRSIRDRGVTILMIEHIMQAISGLSDRVVVLDHGEKIADGNVADVLSDERIAQVYLGSRARH